MNQTQSSASNSTQSPDSAESAETAPENEAVPVTKTWVILGILATLVGIAAGLIMSTATFVK